MHHFARHTIGSAVVAAMALVLLAPGQSAGAPAANPATLFTKPFVHKGYSWTLMATDGKPDSLILFATRRVGAGTQTHTYSFSSGVTFVASATLGSAKLTAKLGSYGTIKATFKGTGSLTTASAPKPCTGPKFQSRNGTLAGVSFVADTTFFRKVGKAALAASLSRQKGAGELKCGTSGTPPKPKPGGLALSGTAAAGEILSITATKAASGAVTQSVTVFEEQAKTAPATVFHSISTPAPSSSFTAAADLSSATVSGAGAFLRGTLSFTALVVSGDAVPGTLSGNYTAAFDSIGPRSPAAAGDLQGILTRG